MALQATALAGYSREDMHASLRVLLAQHERELSTFIEDQWAQWQAGLDKRLPEPAPTAITRAPRSTEMGVDSVEGPGGGQVGLPSTTEVPKQPAGDGDVAVEEHAGDGDVAVEEMNLGAVGSDTTPAAQMTTRRDGGRNSPADAGEGYRPDRNAVLGCDGADDEQLQGRGRVSDATIAKVRGSNEKHRIGVDSAAILTESTKSLDVQACWVRFVHSVSYEGAVVFMILVNAVFIGVETHDYALRSSDDDHETPAVFVWAHYVFLAFFTFELCLRAAAYKYEFCSHKDRGWNFFDLLVVSLMWVDTAYIFMASNETGEKGRGVASLRIVRSIRIIRALRIIRVLRFFKELTSMLSSILMSMSSLFWVIILMSLHCYVFAITLTQGVSDYLTDKDGWAAAKYQDMRDKFGRVDASILSLFEGMAGGISWGELYDALHHLHWAYLLQFLFFIAFSLFALVNVITGVFVTSAMERAHDDKETLIQEALAEKEAYLHKIHLIFKEIDTDRDGQLTYAEMEKAINDERMDAYLDALGLKVEDVQVLFALIDPDGSGFVDVKEFLTGCLKLKGEAKGIDLAMMQYQVKWLMKKTNALPTSVAEALRKEPENQTI